MTKKAQIVISNAMKYLGLNYGFMEYPVSEDGSLPPIYFTGEYQEIEPLYEHGLQESKFILNGFARATWSELENEKEKICNYFNKVSGKTVKTEDGSVVTVFYSDSLVIPTGNDGFKRIQINLDVKEWSVI